MSSTSRVPDCEGTRLNEVARAVTFGNYPITEVGRWTVSDTRAVDRTSSQLKGRDADIARDVVSEIEGRLQFLEEVGLGYLSLDRAAPTLSGGEAQRIRLAAQLGSNLQGVCYVLDEPTIGLHPRDNQILLDALKKLGDKGNTLVVVEHDEDTIRRADHIIDIGPGAGKRGGTVVAQGGVGDLAAHKDSLTGQFLAQPDRASAAAAPRSARGAPRSARPTPEQWLTVEGATLHNLRNVTASMPLDAARRDHGRVRLRQIDARARRADDQSARCGRPLGAVVAGDAPRAQGRAGRRARAQPRRACCRARRRVRSSTSRTRGRAARA